MRTGERLAMAIVLGGVFLAGSAAAAATYAWHAGGTFRIAVREVGPDGSNVSMRLPGALVNAAIALCPVPQAWNDGEIDDALAAAVPVLEAVADHLGSMPDAILVDIKDGDTRVRIAKSGGSLTIRVRDPETFVEVDLPVKSVRSLASKLAHAARGGPAPARA